MRSPTKHRWWTVFTYIFLLLMCFWIGEPLSAGECLQITSEFPSSKFELQTVTQIVANLLKKREFMRLLHKSGLEVLFFQQCPFSGFLSIAMNNRRTSEWEFRYDALRARHSSGRYQATVPLTNSTSRPSKTDRLFPTWHHRSGISRSHPKVFGGIHVGRSLWGF